MPPGPRALGQKILNEKHCPLLWSKMSDSREYKWKQMLRFSMKCEIPVLTRKQKGKVSIVESFLWLFRARRSIAQSLRKKNSKFPTLKIHTIKCVMTELGWAGWEIFGFRSWHLDLCAMLGPCVMTSSQILSRPALPLSQLVHSISQRL